MLTVFTNYGFEYLMKHRCFQNQLPANAKDRAAVRSNAEKYNANKKRFDKIIHDSNQKSALAFKQLTQSKNKNCPTFKFDYNKEEEAEGDKIKLNAVFLSQGQISFVMFVGTLSIVGFHICARYKAF